MLNQAWSIPVQTQEMGSLVLLWEGVTRAGFNPWVGTIPCRKKWQIPTLLFLSGKSQGVKKSQDMTNHTYMHQGTGCKWKRKNFQLLKSKEPMRPCLSKGWLTGRGQGREDWSKGWESQEDLGEQSNCHNWWIILTVVNETGFKEMKKVVEHCRKYASERVTGRKARGLQMEKIACKCQTFLSLLSGRRKQTSDIFSLSIQI